MDAERFDNLARTLQARSRRGFFGVLSGLTLGGALASWLGLGEAAARKGKHAQGEGKKGKGKKKKKKRGGGQGTVQPGAGSAPPPPPPPGCVAEPAEETCAGRCGTWVNTCGEAVVCPSCPAGRTCLANGSCAAPCAEPNTVCTDFGTTCVCGPTNVEGQRYCVIPQSDAACAQQASCASTAQCPPGQTCQVCGVSGLRCLPVCGCSGDGQCAPGQFCTQGQCVTGQGTCPAGATSCVDRIGCDQLGFRCSCVTTMDGQTRCANFDALSVCNTCTSDAQCAASFPAIPGVFCAKGLDRFCDCETGQNRCMAPCPS
jgi:hypothetical protein